MFQFKVDDKLLAESLAESREQLTTMEADLLAMEEEGAQIDEERVNRIFRTVHTLKGAAGLTDLRKIADLAHRTENVLALIRSRKLAPTPDSVRILLRATDCLSELLENPDTSNQANITETLFALTRLYEEHRAPLRTRDTRTWSRGHRNGILRVLLVEDDFASRLLLQTFLSRYGECHIAVNGREAVDACRVALDRSQPYDLICMDIMMPEMDGREAVRQVRALEEARGTLSTCGAKIFMTTTVEEVREVVLCFKELCDAYLMKPIDLGQLLSYMKSHQLVS
jgi:two-component system chemotaxis response regulator CheY